MSEASSVSKGPIVTKILIDMSEYRNLLKAKAFQEEYEKKLKEEYAVKHSIDKNRHGADVNLPKNEKLTEKVIEDAPVGQVGQGSSNGDLTTLIKQLIQEQLLQTSQEPQSGSGANDLAAQVPLPVEIEDHEPISGEALYSKSDENSKFDENILLQKISSKNVSKARALLKAFDEDPNTITWDSNGVVFINGVSLANSNMFILLPELYKQSPNKKLPGFLELATEIATLGLGHLIAKGILRGLQRPGPMNNQSQIYQDLKITDNWWFIG
jgi:hypothetical protein